jgi:hypothetical protein
MSPSSQRGTWGREGLWSYSILVVLGDGKTGEVSEVEAILMPYGHVHDAAHHRCCCGGSHVSLLGVSGMTSASSSNKATRAKQEMYSMYLHVQQSGSVFIATGEQEIGHIPVYRRACLHDPRAMQHEAHESVHLQPYPPGTRSACDTPTRGSREPYRPCIVARRVRVYHTFSGPVCITR